MAMANVALYYALCQQPLVPDVLISLDVEVPADFGKKENRTYFTWEYGKLPDVVVEIVSNRKGQELGYKLAQYARLGIAYYIVYVPNRLLGNKTLHVYTWKDAHYQESKKLWLPAVGLGVMLWTGNYRDMETTWLRRQYEQGNLLLTGQERAEVTEERAETTAVMATMERERAERLAAQLRAFGVEPE